VQQALGVDHKTTGIRSGSLDATGIRGKGSISAKGKEWIVRSTGIRRSGSLDLTGIRRSGSLDAAGIKRGGLLDTSSHNRQGVNR
jgi:hypothetical protein